MSLRCMWCGRDFGGEPFRYRVTPKTAYPGVFCDQHCCKSGMMAANDPALYSLFFLDYGSVYAAADRSLLTHFGGPVSMETFLQWKGLRITTHPPWVRPRGTLKHPLEPHPWVTEEAPAVDEDGNTIEDEPEEDETDDVAD